MKAAWYETTGVTKEVLKVGELPTPEPSDGEVRVKITFSGVNPGDTKKRADWMGYGMAYEKIIPHSDGAGVIDAVGSGVDENRIGERVWIFGAQSGRPFGTAAEYCAVPENLVVSLPDEVSDEMGAALGIPGITAHEVVLSDGAVKDKIVLVQGVLGGVGALAAQIAHRDGARVFGTVRSASELENINGDIVEAAFSLDDEKLVEKIKERAPNGIDRIIEVDFSDNINLDAEIIAPHGVIAAYATRQSPAEMPFWLLLFANTTIKLYGSDDFTIEAKRRAALDLTDATKEGALTIPIGELLPLDAIAVAHDKVDTGSRERVLVKVG